MVKRHHGRIVEMLMKFAMFAATSGAGTIVDLGLHWFLSSRWMVDNYLWTFWITPLISFEASVLTNFLIAYNFVWRERISHRNKRSFFRHYAAYNAVSTGVFFIKLLLMQGIHLLFLGAGWFQNTTYEPVLCNLLAICVSGCVSFVVNEFVIFRKVNKKESK